MKGTVCILWIWWKGLFVYWEFDYRDFLSHRYCFQQHDFYFLLYCLCALIFNACGFIVPANLALYGSLYWKSAFTDFVSLLNLNHFNILKLYLIACKSDFCDLDIKVITCIVQSYKDFNIQWVPINKGIQWLYILNKSILPELAGTQPLHAFILQPSWAKVRQVKYRHWIPTFIGTHCMKRFF